MLSSQWFPTESLPAVVRRDPPTPREFEIHEWLRSQSEPVPLLQIAGVFNAAKNTMRMHMWRLSCKGLAKSTAKGGITARWVAL